jgi:hypothetical protein
MKTKLLNSILLAFATTVLVAGCSTSSGTLPQEVAVPSAPPPKPNVVNMASPMPGPDCIWIEGLWAWTPQDQWRWVEGYWDRRPYDDALWMPAHYEFRDGQHYLVRGEWE